MKRLLFAILILISINCFSQVTTTLDGSASNDPDGGGITGYRWRQISGPAATISNTSVVKPTVTFTIAGTYIFGLIVTDNEGAVSTEDQVQIIVKAANIKPKADAGSDQTVTLPGIAMLTMPAKSVRWIKSIIKQEEACYLLVSIYH